MTLTIIMTTDDDKRLEQITEIFQREILGSHTSLQYSLLRIKESHASIQNFVFYVVMKIIQSVRSKAFFCVFDLYY